MAKKSTKTKACSIKFGEAPRGLKVKLIGQWRRADVDLCYSAMLKELKSCMVKQRQQDLEEGE